jgi:hypothetical protein
MTKRTILVGFGAILGTWFATRATHKLREHASDMAAHCKEMMAARNGGCEAPSGRDVEKTRKKQRVAVPSA